MSKVWGDNSGRKEVLLQMRKPATGYCARDTSGGNNWNKVGAKHKMPWMRQLDEGWQKVLFGMWKKNRDVRGSG